MTNIRVNEFVATKVLERVTMVSKENVLNININIRWPKCISLFSFSTRVKWIICGYFLRRPIIGILEHELINLLHFASIIFLQSYGHFKNLFSYFLQNKNKSKAFFENYFMKQISKLLVLWRRRPLCHN